MLAPASRYKKDNIYRQDFCIYMIKDIRDITFHIICSKTCMDNMLGVTVAMK